MNRNLVFLFTSSLYLLSLISPVKAEDTLAKIQRTGVLSVAIREDAPPFGYLDANHYLYRILVNATPVSSRRERFFT